MEYREPLTPRQRDVLDWLREGKTDKEIALILNISPKTVHGHVSTILSKLGVENRISAALFAAESAADGNGMPVDGCSSGGMIRLPTKIWRQCVRKAAILETCPEKLAIAMISDCVEQMDKPTPGVPHTVSEYHHVRHLKPQRSRR